MAKQVYTYIMISVGMLLVFQLAGIGVAENQVLEYIGLGDGLTFGDLTVSSFYIRMLAVFAAAGVGGFVLGFLSNRSVESFIVGGFVGGVFALFFPVFWKIVELIQVHGDWTGLLAAAVLVPYMIGFGIALVDFWRGAD